MTDIFDAHFDLLSDISHKRNQGRKQVFESDFYDKLKTGGVKYLIASIFLEKHQLNNPFYYAMEQIGYLYQEIRESPELLMLIKSKKDLEACKNSKKIGLILSFEGAEPLLKAQDLYTFYELGVRLLGLSWSRRNIYADGCDYREGNKKGGLTSKGFELVEIARSLGMPIDVSHLSDEGLEDIIALDIPFVASHSNANSITPTPRSLKDKYLDLLKDRDFMLGVNGAHFIITRDGVNADFQDFAVHTDYLIKKLGEDKVGIGLDLCNCLSVFAPADSSKGDVIYDHSSAQELILHLEKTLGSQINEKVAWKNWYNFMMRHLP